MKKQKINTFSFSGPCFPASAFLFPFAFPPSPGQIPPASSFAPFAGFAVV